MKTARQAFSLFELLVIIAIIIILLGLFLPAVAKVREAAARSQGMNNIKQLLLSCHNFNDTYGKLPQGDGPEHFSAIARLLPFNENQNVFRKIDFTKSVDDKANAEARAVAIAMLRSPADPQETVKPGVGPTSYVFSDLSFPYNTEARIPQSFTDGLSNTVFCAETLKGDNGTKAVDVRRQHVGLKKADLKTVTADSGVKPFADDKDILGDRCASWMDGRFLQTRFNGGLKPNDERPDVSCEGWGGVSAIRSLTGNVSVGMADGSTRTVNAAKVSHKTWQAALTPNGGEILGEDW